MPATPLDPVIGAAIGTIGSLIGSGAGIASDIALSEKEFEQNKQIMREQNEYNSPAKQMERLKAAGLNPYLVYGSSNVAGNSTVSAPTLRYKDVKVNTGDPAADYQKISLQNQQAEGIELNNALARVTARGKELENKDMAGNQVIYDKLRKKGIPSDAARDFISSELTMEEIENAFKGKETGTGGIARGLSEVGKQAIKFITNKR